MGRRTGKEPDSSDSFLWRICHALDETPKGLAKSLGLSYEKDIKPLLCGQKDKLAEIDRDEVWWTLQEYVARKIGYLMAIRSELNKALQKDRAKRIQRHKRFRDYHGL